MDLQRARAVAFTSRAPSELLHARPRINYVISRARAFAKCPLQNKKTAMVKQAFP